MATAVQEKELKQQGAFEAAADPKSNVTAADAEKLAIAESKKAGVVAYVFDPDASTKDKQRQAKSNIPDDFHHKPKMLGVAVVTDIDDGRPGAYDLPSLSQAGKAGAVPLPKDKAGKPIKPGSGDELQEGDQERWIDRTGWAPRFGQGVMLDADESYLDEQTWVEGKLPDMFYGDWYHNTAVIIFACLMSWIIAVLGGGLAWVFLVMAASGTYYRTSLRRVRRNFRDDVTREMAKTRIENDSESLEWINNFLNKFWPIYAPVIADTVINSVDQVLSTSTPAFLDSMRMRFFTLGSKPPRMEHVRSYPNSNDDTVLMDWKFSFTPNDTADMTKRQIQNKINPKVILEIRIGKAMVSKAMDIIVEDFAFSGIMRVKVKLQIPFPHVEKVEICFLEKPVIDYVCKPLGGEYLGFDINFIPGLESFIMDQIHSNLSPIMYAPNVFPIEVAKMLSGSAVDKAIGVVAITIHRGNGLKNPDKFAGTPDPYITLSLNAGAVLAQTKIVKENANPVWNETKYIIITSLNDSLTLQVFDYNEFRKDKELGTASYALEQVADVHEQDNQQLEVISNGKTRGVISADIRFFPVLTGGRNAEGKEEPVPESNTGIARFTVEQAKDLDGTKSLIGQLSPYVILLLNNREIFVSKKLKRTNNPIWDSCHKEILITDRKSAKLGLVIKDDRGLAIDPIIGTYQIKLNDMMDLMEKGQEWYNIAGAQTGRVKMTLNWKPVALTGVGAGTGGYVTPIGVMRIHFINARGIRNLETMGKSDPYGRVLLSGIEKGRTVTFRNNLDPDFEEVIYVPMHNNKEKLTLEIMDEESLGNDRTLGQLDVFANDYIRQGENGEYLVNDEKKPLAGGLKARGKGIPKGTLNYTVAFYPCLNIADPEYDEKEESERKKSSEAGRISIDKGSEESSRKSSEDNKDAIKIENEKSPRVSIGSDLQRTLAEGEKEQSEVEGHKELPKLRLSPEELLKYESGLVIFKLLDAELIRTDVMVEILVDDMVYPSYTSAVAKSKKTTFDEIGDCFIRELEFSKLTIRLREKGDSKDDPSDKIIAKLTGNTLDTVRQCLNNPTILKLRDDKGQLSNIRVSLKYLPVDMVLDPSESINNMGSLRVDVLDATNLPSADRNGYSDPYCKFELNGHTVFKTQVQKKTLHPAWNEFFETEIPSRTAAKFNCRVYDWDALSDPDFLGATAINLELLEPFKPQEYNLTLDGKSGTIRLRLLFRPTYITRARHGSSTFSGTFAVPGKIVNGVAGVPFKGVGYAAGGVGKGASFLKNTFLGKKNTEDTNGAAAQSPESVAVSLAPAPAIIADDIADKESPTFGENSSPTPSHQRNKSTTAASIYSTNAGPAPTGTGSFAIISAEGFPPSSSIMVLIKALPSKKTLHKTKHLKDPSGAVTFNEKFTASCSADTQFQLQVRNHTHFGSDDILGQALFFIDESGTEQEKTIQVGSGSVIIKSNFEMASNGATDSPKHAGGSMRRSFLSKRENGRISREGTPS